MTQHTPMPNRIYRARIFEMVFSRKEECLSLYNAVNQTDYTDPEQLEINTLENAKTLPIAEAVEEAIDSCIKEGILEEFLKQNRAEVISMSIFEYDEEKHMRQEREENLERGRAEGREEGMTSKLLQNIKGLMETTGWSAEEAMDKMQVSERDREMVRPLL